MSNIMEKELFIFDWDGTLSTSTLIVAASRIFRKSYRPKNIKKNTQLYKQIGKRTLSVELKQDSSKAFAFLYDFYARMYMPKTKRGSIELLSLLNKKGKKIALFSDSRSYRLMSEIRSLNMTKYFDFILSASSVGAYKPDPTGILFILDRYGIKKSKAVYIGDTVSDIMAARFAGINSCIVGDGLEPYEKIKNSKPTYLFKSIEEMYENL